MRRQVSISQIRLASAPICRPTFQRYRRKRERDQGDPRPGRLGGDRRSDRIEAHHDAVVAALV